MSQVRIDRMAQKTEDFCAESESDNAKIEAKNGSGITGSACATL